MRVFLILSFCYLMVNSLCAQQRVRVNLIDYYTNEPLKYVHHSLSRPVQRAKDFRQASDTLISYQSSLLSDSPLRLVIWKLSDLEKINFTKFEVRKYVPSISNENSIPRDSTITIYLSRKNLQSYKLNEVVLPASMKDKKSPSSISTLGKRELQRDQQLTIAPVLNRVPGVYMHIGTLGTSRLTIRGMGARSLFSTTRVKAYVENIPLSTGDGESTIEDLDLPLIDNISVIRGPASSLFGAGLGGTLLMESDASVLNGQGVSGLLQFGSFNTRRASIKARTGDGKSGLGIHANYLSSDGWRENNRYDRFQASFQAKFLLDERSTLSMLGTILDVKGFIPSSIDSATFADSPESAAFTWNRTAGNEDYFRGLLGINYQRKLNHAWKIQSSVPLTYRANDELRPFNFLRETALTVGNRTVLEGHPRIGGKFVEIFIGEEIFQEFYAWQTYQNIGGLGEIGGTLSDNREERRYINAFAQVNYALSSKLDLTLGSNFNQTWYNYEDFYFADSVNLSGNYAFNGIFSPRLALRYELGKNHFLHGQASHGFSPPLLSETLTPDGQLNPDIQPETGWNYEMGIKGKLQEFSTSPNPAEKLGLDYSITAYLLNANNLLVPRRVGNDQFVGVNAGSTRHIGLESEFHFQKSFLRTMFWFELWGSYAFMHHTFINFSDEESGEVFDGNFLPGIPQHNGNLGLSLNYPLFIGSKYSLLSLHLNSQITSSMFFRDDNKLSSSPYQLLNAKISWQQYIKGTGLVKGNSVTLSFGIQNLLDAQYASMILVNAGSFGGQAPRYFYPGMPRNYYIDLQFDLNTKK